MVFFYYNDSNFFRFYLTKAEALALEWDDFDFKNQIIHINKTIQANIKNFNPDADKKTYSKL